MDKIIDLAKELQIPDESIYAMQKLIEVLPWLELQSDIVALQSPSTGADAVKSIEKKTAPYSQNGTEQLCVYLAAALDVRNIYRERSISDDVFISTMLCFSRFVAETYQSKGIYGYDRGFWTWRQLSCSLFRLGALEYEYLPLENDITGADGTIYKKGEHVISVHIPSGVELSQQSLNASYSQAKVFFAKAGNITEYSDTPRVLYCSTWLLAPSLVALCPENSGIRRFAQMYTIYNEDEQNEMYKGWLFGADDNTLIEDYPEKSSLQRAVKAHLLSGKNIGTASGLIKLMEIN